jgi:hypothetical protein
MGVATGRPAVPLLLRRDQGPHLDGRVVTRPDLERAHRGARSSISLSPAMAPRTSGFTTRYLSGDHVRHLLRD